MNRADAIIIGGGSSGLSTAYWLTKKGMTNVLLLERSYLSSGATGRCLGGIRAQFSAEADIRLALESQRMYERLGGELGFDPLFRQGGYLFMAFDEKDMELYQRNSEIQNKYGVHSRMVTPDEIGKLAPALNTKALVGGCFNPKDGTAVHFAVSNGFAEKARKQGATLRPFTAVEQIDTAGGRVTGVQTSDGLVATDVVVCVAGVHSVGLLAPLGIELPLRPRKQEVLVTEPIKPFLDPMLVSVRGHSMFQTLRGEFVAECGERKDERPDTMSWSSTFPFLETCARKLLELLPCMRDVRVARQWAGTYDTSPDHRPVLQAFSDPAGLLLASGFSGHGFMLAPMVGKIMAELAIDGQSRFDISSFDLARFSRPGLRSETMVI